MQADAILILALMGLSLGAMRVLVHLSRRAGRKGEAYPGTRSIARICGMDRHTVIAAIKELERSGLVTTVKQKGRATRYRLFQKLTESGAEKRTTVVRKSAPKGSPSKVIQFKEEEEKTPPPPPQIRVASEEKRGSGEKRAEKQNNLSHPSSSSSNNHRDPAPRLEVSSANGTLRTGTAITLEADITLHEAPGPRTKMTNEILEWMEKDPLYADTDLREEGAKFRADCEKKKRPCNYGRFVKWLARNYEVQAIEEEKKTRGG